MASVDPTAPFRESLAKERQLSRSLTTQLRDRDADIAELQSKLDQAQAADRERDLAALASLTPVVIEPTAHASGAPGYPVTIWSDWHWGETVDIREMNFHNAFNREIAEARVASLINSTVGLLRDYAGLNPEYPGIWVCLGGDMISGSIHEELRETNWGTVEEQVDQVSNVLAGALTRMADEFGRVDVPCVVGNHGRFAIKPRAKQQVRENREWGVYKRLEAHFKGDPRLTFYIPDGPDFYFTVYGHRFMLTHGDRMGVKGGDGIIGSIGPIKRGNVKIRGAESDIGRPFDTMVIGHWHAYQPTGALLPVVVNGSLKGFDEYAKNMLRVPFAPPAQALWLVSPKHGIAAQWRVDTGNLIGVDQ